ncbi:hypothetical protein J7T55_014497 [Diaporthe amygdali]|uniref:uncharacterized protein n=1 Tax=Phomopsis amygdali TaxID=1214568 RepID=UPI0022FDE367|nr:uncharacterized protein J7T55_014497 [Diaporthe amygdali]KAJ0118044.1 hypothetical protein J7T55_014497 [Diaporthe amygdali]
MWSCQSAAEQDIGDSLLPRTPTVQSAGYLGVSCARCVRCDGDDIENFDGCTPLREGLWGLRNPSRGPTRDLLGRPKTKRSKFQDFQDFQASKTAKLAKQQIKLRAQELPRQSVSLSTWIQKLDCDRSGLERQQLLLPSQSCHRLRISTHHSG